MSGQMEMAFRALSGNPSNCIELYGITKLSRGGEKEGVFLIFELASNGRLEQYIKNGMKNFSWEQVLELVVGIAEGLDGGLHQKGIAHGYGPGLTRLYPNLLAIYMKEMFS